MLARKVILAAMGAVMLCSSAMAEEISDRTTLSLGYQRGYIKGFGKLHGNNINLQYETDSPWGAMGSFTAMKKEWGDDSFSQEYRKKSIWNTTDRLDDIRNAKYYSAMIGPTYRLSDKISFFALGGISHSKVDNSLIVYPGDAHHKPGNMKNGSESSNRFAYAAGVTVNATDNLAVTVGYEGSSASFEAKNHPMSSMFVNVGYHF